jgi:hypothetical protein
MENFIEFHLKFDEPIIVTLVGCILHNFCKIHFEQVLLPTDVEQRM